MHSDQKPNSSHGCHPCLARLSPGCCGCITLTSGERFARRIQKLVAPTAADCARGFIPRLGSCNIPAFRHPQPASRFLITNLFLWLFTTKKYKKPWICSEAKKKKIKKTHTQMTKQQKPEPIVSLMGWSLKDAAGEGFPVQQV